MGEICYSVSSEPQCGRLDSFLKLKSSKHKLVRISRVSLAKLLMPSVCLLVLTCLCLDSRLNVFSPHLDTMSTISPTDFDSLEIQQQYNDINNRWDLASETDWDNENSSARLFERSRIKALAGMQHSRSHHCACLDCVNMRKYVIIMTLFDSLWRQNKGRTWETAVHLHFEFYTEYYKTVKL